MTRIRLRFSGLVAGALALHLLPLQADEPVDFHEQVFPFLEARCFKCHSDKKQKGDLRLDSPAWILRGSENGKILTAGNADDSPLYYLTTYDEDDPDYMPSKGKGLTAEEKDLLKRWIEEGASFGEEMDGMMALSPDSPHEDSVKKKYATDVPLPPASYELPATLAEVVASLETHGLGVDTVNHDAEFLEITFTYAMDADAYDLSLLAPVADSVVLLNYGRSRVLDANLKGVGQFEKVTYLDLRKTAVTDAALAAVSELDSLEYLNLYGTVVSDEGLKSLRRLKSLRQLYLHDTAVTDAGVRALQKALPTVKVVR